MADPSESVHMSDKYTRGRMHSSVELLLGSL